MTVHIASATWYRKTSPNCYENCCCLYSYTYIYVVLDICNLYVKHFLWLHLATCSPSSANLTAIVSVFRLMVYCTIAWFPCDSTALVFHSCAIPLQLSVVNNNARTGVRCCQVYYRPIRDVCCCLSLLNNELLALMALTTDNGLFLMHYLSTTPFTYCARLCRKVLTVRAC